MANRMEQSPGPSAHSPRRIKAAAAASAAASPSAAGDPCQLCSSPTLPPPPQRNHGLHLSAVGGAESCNAELPCCGDL